MTELSITEFKKTCLRVVDQVARGGDEIVITRHGQPLAKVVALASGPAPLDLRGSVVECEDIVSPLAEVWEADA